MACGTRRVVAILVEPLVQRSAPTVTARDHHHLGLIANHSSVMTPADSSGSLVVHLDKRFAIQRPEVSGP